MRQRPSSDDADRAATSWRDRALCAQTDPWAFFPEKGDSARAAKAVCRACPVQQHCLEFALTHDQHFGVWGGLSERERRRVAGQGRQNVHRPG